MMGVKHIENILALPGSEVMAVGDPHPASLERAVTVIGHPSRGSFIDHRDLLASGLSDVVVVATPNMTRPDILDDVLAVAELHVLVEEPQCTTVEDCRRVVAAAEGRPGLVWMGLEYRYCHFFDLMILLTGSDPVRVMASGAQDVNHLDEDHDGQRPDVPDNAYVVIDYANAARAALDLCMFAEASHNQEEVSVVGDAGKAEAFLSESTFRTGTASRGQASVTTETVHDERVAHEGLHHGSSFVEHLLFADAIRSGGRPGVTLDEGLLSVAVGVAAHRSIDEGRIVAMDEVLAA